MKKNNVSNPAANLAAFVTLSIIAIAAKKMIKKYHKKQETFY